ncbi:MAG: hypothetical protein HKN00_13485 [Flavobacteriaceae bacterium]|nr:hypothetical protein [Bacteroidia bacterium]MBT8288815.1 hypothetical protein [Bacteroidia bacterium]NNF76191.1 hypothetical protein [Flavobacteriaceae bacterium]NNK72870.1 hypothetical protein [Flavobacteriaceae bacterium]
MKKKLESELISIAHRILKLKGKEDIDRLHKEVAQLYEKLTVMKFAHENFDEDMPTIGSDSSFFGMLDEAFNNKVSDNIEIEDKVYINLDEKEDDGIMEPAMETIKDIVAQMPEETQELDEILEEAIARPSLHKNDLEDITSAYRNLPVFEPVVASKEDNQKSLNERLKGKIIQIGLNDKLAFIKHLFGGNAVNYERALLNLNATTSLKDALILIENKIKPSQSNWIGKEEYEERFLEIIESKFE